jgi:RPA family protein
MNVDLVLVEVPQIGTEHNYWLASVHDRTDGYAIHFSHDYDDEKEALETTVAWCEQWRHHIVEVVRRPMA